jgi:hypothetical protein
MAVFQQTIDDHTSGVNVSFSPDVDVQSYLLSARNARTSLYGSVEKRASTQRIHESAVGGGAAIKGIHQWNGPSGRQTLAVSNGSLWHKTSAQADFSQVALGLDTSARVSFAAHKSTLDGSPQLYFVDGSGSMYYFDGSTAYSVTSGVPTLTRIKVYNNRMFGIGEDNLLYYSAIDDPESWTAASGAGAVRISTYDTENLIALEVVGGSLLLFKENSVARYTGYDILDMRVQTDTVGVSADVGAIAAESVLRVEDVVFFISDRGPYMATEAGVRFIGLPVERAWAEIPRDSLATAVVSHNKTRREVSFFVPSATESENLNCWRYNYRSNSWWGPDDFQGFNVSAAAQYERDDGSESLVVGGYDGFVRDADASDLPSARDDVLADGTGGKPIPMWLEYRPFNFGDNSRMKLMYVPQDITADLGQSGRIVQTWESEVSRRSTEVTSRAKALRTYRTRPAVKGKRVFMSMLEETDELTTITELVLRAKIGKARPV